MIRRSWLLFPVLVPSDYYRHIFIIALMWVVIGSSWNLLAGYHRAGFLRPRHLLRDRRLYGRLVRHQARHLRLVGHALGGPVALLVGLFIGWICFRLRGPYFALATIAIGEIFRLVATVWRDFTEGMQGILIMQTFRSKIPYYYLALLLAAVCVYAIYRVMHSKWGYYFVAIREDQDAAEAMGISASATRASLS